MSSDMLKGLAPDVRSAFEALRRTYVDGLSQRLKEMEQAMSGEEWLALGSCAHRLRGSAAGYGFQTLSDLAKRLEEQSSAALGEGIGLAFVAIRDEIQSIQRTRGSH